MGDAPLYIEAEGHVAPESLEERRKRLEASLLRYTGILSKCSGCMNRRYIPKDDYVCRYCRESMEQHCDAA